MSSSCQGKNKRIQRTITVAGVVQGVGFRPFVYSLASELNLSGTVRNSGGTVEIVIEGDDCVCDRFVSLLHDRLPPLANIEHLTVAETQVRCAPGFRILESEKASGTNNVVPADASTCKRCLVEFNDPCDRRHFYPFINCTDCGPRFTIIQKLPYDRPVTTMSEFVMCTLCAQEYADPANRRFHAQPNACWECGPAVWFGKAPSAVRPPEINRARQLEYIDAAIARLKNGDILAIKGLGGFHLACAAANDDAVNRLRLRKHREEKPFAVMFSDAEQAGRCVELSDEATALLNGNSSPIVLLPPGKAPDGQVLSPNIICGSGEIGVMLPYTPLQHLLLKRFGAPLVMTSANVSDEPICMDNQEAISRLSGIADGFLLHDRKIETRFDDSVVRFNSGSPIMIRRARGYAPAPVSLPVSLSTTTLSLGGQLKGTFALGRDTRAYISQHIGDLFNVDALKFYEDTLTKFYALFDLKPRLIVHDLHPDYSTTQLAQRVAMELEIPAVGVQHHHAHIVSCMVDNKLAGRVIGVALDGTGYGDDGTVWGGEIMLADYASYRRVGAFEAVPMPGNEAAIKRPARMLAAYLSSLPAEVNGVSYMQERVNASLSDQELSAVRQQLRRGFNSPATSSCGRLFDAAAVMLGINGRPTFEGQAAMALESLASVASDDEECETPDFGSADGELSTMISGPRILAHVAALRSVWSVERCARYFHKVVANSVARVCANVAESEGVDQVCLSGGVMQNSLLLKFLLTELNEFGLRSYTQKQVPPNDGGLSLGQLVAGAAKFAAMKEVR